MRLQVWLACILVCVCLNFADSCKCRHCLSADLRLRDNNLINDPFEYIKNMFPCCDVCRGSEDICGIINSKCGIKNDNGIKKRSINEAKSKDDTRIVNGTPTKEQEYPWMVAIRALNSPLIDRSKPFCGGSLIASKWVLTTGLCVNGLLFDIEVALGEHVINDPATAGNIDIFQVDEIFVHPNLLVVPPPGVNENDIALLRLTDEVDLNNYTPICLPSPNINFDLQSATAIGWGLIQQLTQPPPPLPVSDELQEIQVTIDNSKCTSQSMRPDGVICADGENGQDTCLLDFGGPLFVSVENGRDRQHFLVGITSSPASCGLSDGSFYTDASFFRRWIVDTLNAEGGATFF